MAGGSRSGLGADIVRQEDLLENCRKLQGLIQQLGQSADFAQANVDMLRDLDCVAKEQLDKLQSQFNMLEALVTLMNQQVSQRESLASVNVSPCQFSSNEISKPKAAND